MMRTALLEDWEGETGTSIQGPIPITVTTSVTQKRYLSINVSRDWGQIQPRAVAGYLAYPGLFEVP
jgi:hypothetical protein